MKWTTIGSALCCVFGSFVWMAALVLPNWRQGTGNWFLTDNPGVADWALFSYKTYGPLWTFGVYFQTWGALSNAVCQKLRVVIGITVVEGVGEEFLRTGSNEKGYCIGGPGSGCADTFAQHFQDRCAWYSQLASLGSFLMLWVSLAFLANMACVMSVFLTRLKDSKFTIMCTLCMVQFMVHTGFWTWVVVSSMAFHRLGQTGTYPFPDLAGGAAVFLVGCFMHFAGVVSFWWFKFGGGKSPPGTDPRAQRAMAMGLLHDQQIKPSAGPLMPGAPVGVPGTGPPLGSMSQPQPNSEPPPGGMLPPPPGGMVPPPTYE